MSIRLRFTLLYNAILALTLIVFGATLYSIQARTTMNALKKDLTRSSETLGISILRMAESPDILAQPPRDAMPPVPFENFSDDQAFQKLPEREIVRILDPNGSLVASPFGRSEDALPLSAEGLQTLEAQTDFWQTASVNDQRMLIYSRPIIIDNQVTFIIQVARPLNERDRSLNALGTTLLAASAITLMAAFGIGWGFSGLTLKPIKRITQTAQAIGEERDFSRRVDYNGPHDEVGQLATTFNSMLARLEDAYQRVAHALEMQRNFVADVSHELRTPLTTLRGNLGLLGRKPAIPEEVQTDIVNDMVDESDRLIRLVNDLLVLARADAGQNLTQEPFDLRPALEEVCRQARALDASRSIALDAPDSLPVIADRDALKQVLLIALDNAIKHSQGEIELSATERDTQIEIRVEDHGSGIPPEQLAHVFDRFYRGEEAAGTPGFGLGLAIARSLVEAQGGDIQIESDVGKGSAVKIRIKSIKGKNCY